VELTPQEQAILQAYAVGWTTEQVAAACGLSPTVVQTHLATIQRKLGALSKLEAVIIALRSGLISQPAPIQPPLIIDRVPEADRQPAIC
jgi:DNA-binding NarL/FixJ family response regulator